MTPLGAICAWLLLLSPLPYQCIRTAMDVDGEEFATEVGAEETDAADQSSQTEDFAMDVDGEDFVSAGESFEIVADPGESHSDEVDCDQFKNVKVGDQQFGEV